MFTHAIYGWFEADTNPPIWAGFLVLGAFFDYLTMVYIVCKSLLK